MNQITMFALKLLLNNSNRDSLLEKNRDTIVKLKFIGTFQPGEKIDVRNLRVETNNVITPIKRMFFGESRDTTYSFMQNTIDRAFEIIQATCNSEKISDKIYCKNIIIDLIKAIKGLQNIQKTYKDDKLFYCNIESIVENIQARLSDVKTKNPEIFTLTTIENDSINELYSYSFYKDNEI